MHICKKIKTYFTPARSLYTSKEIFKWLWVIWKGNMLQAFLNVLLGVMGVVLSLTSVWAIHNAIDIASGARPGSIYWGVGIMGMIVLCNFSISISAIWVRNILGIRARNHMQQHILDRLLKSEWHSKGKRHTGDVINRLATDVGRVINFLTETLPSSVCTLALFIGAFAYLFSMDKILILTEFVLLQIRNEVLALKFFLI